MATLQLQPMTTQVQREVQNKNKYLLPLLLKTKTNSHPFCYYYYYDDDDTNNHTSIHINSKGVKITNIQTKLYG